MTTNATEWLTSEEVTNKLIVMAIKEAKSIQRTRDHLEALLDGPHSEHFCLDIRQRFEEIDSLLEARIAEENEFIQHARKSRTR